MKTPRTSQMRAELLDTALKCREDWFLYSPTLAEPKRTELRKTLRAHYLWTKDRFTEIEAEMERVIQNAERSMIEDLFNPKGPIDTRSPEERWGNPHDIVEAIMRRVLGSGPPM
jgi:hypothetical protein